LHAAAINACSASVLSASRRPPASARSSSAASRFASVELPSPSTVLLAGFAAACRRCTDLAGFAAGGVRIAARRAILAVLGEDINLIPFLDHFVFA
jgi:hypothetical protein